MMQKPTFLIIGAQKCGTTSLYEYLGQHPEVFVSPVKELRYFSGEAASEDAAAIDGPVISDFPSYCEYFEGAAGYPAAGEVSPSYMFYPGTAERIHRHLPDVRLIAILRDPVDRAFSEYWHHWKMGRRLSDDFLDFVRSEDVEAEPRRSEYQDCVRRGLYYRQLKPYFQLFDHRQLLVLLYEDLKANAKALVRRAYDHIGVDTGFQPETNRARNRGVMPRKDWKYMLAQIREWWIERRSLKQSTRMEYRRRIRRGLHSDRKTPSAEVREKLVPLFKDDVHKLGSLLGHNFRKWMTAEKKQERGGDTEVVSEIEN